MGTMQIQDSSREVSSGRDNSITCTATRAATEAEPVIPTHLLSYIATTDFYSFISGPDLLSHCRSTYHAGFDNGISLRNDCQTHDGAADGVSSTTNGHDHRRNG